MMQRPVAGYVLTTLSAILIMVSVANFRAFSNALGHREVKRPEHAAQFSETLLKIEKALVADTRTVPFQFTGLFDPPFRTSVRTAANASAKAAPSHSRRKLSLKGILLKNVPLAIIEDDQGTTHIRGVGEMIAGQQIVGIKADVVVMRDRGGTYDLTVQEK